MKEELKNLTPEMVEELKQLGVEFAYTQLTWHDNGKLLITDYLFLSDGYNEYNCCPAPNLQEVLEKLPFCIPNTRKELAYAEWLLESGVKLINIDEYDNRVPEYYLYYYGYEATIYMRDSNPLIAAFELLCYVAANYPESIIKK